MNCGCDPSRAVTQNAATGADNGLSRVASGNACAVSLVQGLCCIVTENRPITPVSGLLRCTPLLAVDPALCDS